jgi:alpha-beta hydrolase superfamily lysophospholipase
MAIKSSRISFLRLVIALGIIAFFTIGHTEDVGSCDVSTNTRDQQSMPKAILNDEYVSGSFIVDPNPDPTPNLKKNSFDGNDNGTYEFLEASSNKLITRKKSKTIVFIHGMYMTPLCWEQWINYYQAKGYKCLGPEHPYPAAIEDSTNAFRWLLITGIKARNIAFAGDSAGGGLTIATMLSLRDAKDPLPAAAVCFSPWTNLKGQVNQILKT